MTKLHYAFAAALMGVATAAVAQDMTATQGMATTTTTKAVVSEVTIQDTGLVATHTVATIMASPKDDAKVTLVGTIGAKLGKEKYAFTDRTGTIPVEIDDEDMPADLKLGQTVRIDGEIDTGIFKRGVEVDVDRVSAI